MLAMRGYTLAGPHRLSSEPADCWDQVAKFGWFVKNDGDGPQEAVFNLEHLGEFMDNFARQVNPLWADWNHEFGDALARYDALALMVGGIPVRTVTRQAAGMALPALEPSKLVNPDTGQIEDGLYAHRFELTPLGQEKLPNVRYVSPLFVTNGQDEQGQGIGYVLLNIAWTNGPFLDSMLPLQMVRLPARFSRGLFKGAVDMNEWMKRYGIDDKATPEQMSAAMAKYAEEVDSDRKRSEDAMSRYRRFADAVGGEEKFGKFVEKFMDSEESMSRFRKFMEGAEDDEDEDKREMSAMAKDLGVAAQMSAIRAKVTELRFTSVPKAELASLKEQLAELKASQARRDAEEREAAVIAFAKKAITERAWDPDDEPGLVAFYKASPQAAQAAVERNKTQKTWDKVIAMQRLTSGGAPVGKPEGEPLDLSGDDTSDVAKKFDEAAKKIATEEKVPYPVAMTRVKAKHPQLYAAYVAARS
jgi:hypothetical protein